ncbi:MAG TPA: DUF5110 domain-containing protein, partial [Flavisolibacter sp.]|nr:DUF5110 domain-containing protein [Flavisolibacter sp.]
DLQYTNEKPVDTLTLYVYAGKDGAFTLYEDEEVNYNYEKGQLASIEFKYNEKQRTLLIENRNGQYAGMPLNRVFRVVYVSKEKSASLDFNTTNFKEINYEGKKVLVKF